jgi:hypothetical protein
MLYSLASKVDASALQAITALERQLRRPILALSGCDVRPAELTEEELSRVRELEGKLGLYLVVVKDLDRRA